MILNLANVNIATISQTITKNAKRGILRKKVDFFFSFFKGTVYVIYSEPLRVSLSKDSTNTLVSKNDFSLFWFPNRL